VPRSQNLFRPSRCAERPPRAENLPPPFANWVSSRGHYGELYIKQRVFCLAGADLLGAERVGRAVEVPGEGADLLDVGELGVDGEIANAHVLEHPLAQRCHGGAPVLWNEGCWGQHVHRHATGASGLRRRCCGRSFRWWPHREALQRGARGIRECPQVLSFA
jgi:hypothetical protein